jgi:hypothetical protein
VPGLTINMGRVVLTSSVRARMTPVTGVRVNHLNFEAIDHLAGGSPRSLRPRSTRHASRRLTPRTGGEPQSGESHHTPSRVYLNVATPHKSNGEQSISTAAIASLALSNTLPSALGVS